MPITDAPPAEAATAEAARRLFFALWPQESMRQAMVQATRKAARASDGRPVPAGNLHVTLAFLGSVPQRQLPQLGEIARRAAAATLGGEAIAPGADGPEIELAFEHLEYWRAAHLLCAVPAEPPARMTALARGLRVLLTEAGFPPDRKSSRSVEIDITTPFRPHVTLARKVYRSPRTVEMQPITWSFTDFVLVDSKTLPEGAVYTVLERFPLDQ